MPVGLCACGAKGAGPYCLARKGIEIPDALSLLERIDLTDKVVPGDAMFCQKNITEEIVERGCDYVFPVKGNQKNLLEVSKRRSKRRFSPLTRWQDDEQKAHGRIEQRTIEVPPAEALGPHRCGANVHA